MPQVQGAGTVFVGGPGGAERVPWYAKIYTGVGGLIKFMLTFDGNGFGYESTADSLTAVAGGQGSATPITTQIARFTTVPASGGAILPATSTIFAASTTQMIGSSAPISVFNGQGTNALLVFPASGESIYPGAPNASFSVAANKSATFYCTSAGQWHAILSA